MVERSDPTILLPASQSGVRRVEASPSESTASGSKSFAASESGAAGEQPDAGRSQSRRADFAQSRQPNQSSQSQSSHADFAQSSQSRSDFAQSSQASESQASSDFDQASQSQSSRSDFAQASRSDLDLSQTADDELTIDLSSTAGVVPDVELSASASGVAPTPKSSTVRENSTGILEVESPTRPLGPLGWLGTRVLPILALGGICAWAWTEISSIVEGPEKVKSVGEMIETRTIGAQDDAHPGTPSATDIDSDDIYDEQKRGLGGAILNKKVERLDLETNKVEERRLSQLLPRWESVFVVNLWATWCGPCKKEFAHFTTLLNGGRKESGWGRDVRFMTMMINDDTELEKAYKDFEDKLPHVDDFVAARSFNDLTAQLQKRKLLPEEIALPVTFVLDCHRQVRWIHLEALDDTTTDELREKISDLRDEIKTDKCKAPKKVTPKKVKIKRVDPESVDDSGKAESVGDGGEVDDTTTGKPPPEGKQGPKYKCPNKVCEAELGETKTNCPRDCLAGQIIDD